MSLEKLLNTFREERSIVKEDGRYVEKTKEGVSLKGVLQRGRLKLTREKKDRVTPLTFRPSTLTYSYCRRKKCAQLAGLVTLYEEKTRPKQQLVFDVGNAYHNIIQRYFWDIGILKGTFRCNSCYWVGHNEQSPLECPQCKRRRSLQYQEVTVKDEDFLLHGRIDGILVIDDTEHILDIKSIANRTVTSPPQQVCFEDLNQPKPDHVVQLNLYMWMSGIHNGHMLYVAKNNQQIHTFHVPYDKKIVEPYIEEIAALITKASAIAEGTSKELPPPCGRDSCDCQNLVVPAA